MLIFLVGDVGVFMCLSTLFLNRLGWTLQVLFCGPIFAPSQAFLEQNCDEDKVFCRVYHEGFFYVFFFLALSPCVCCVCLFVCVFPLLSVDDGF